VFRDKIADKGLSISPLSSIIFTAFLSPASAFDFRNDVDKESKVASAIEQINDTAKARNK
jgi:hypothetical protein